MPGNECYKRCRSHIKPVIKFISLILVTMLPNLCRNLLISLSLTLWCATSAWAQRTDDYLQQFIEIITENSGGGEEFDYSDLGEQLDDWKLAPIKINSAEAGELVQWKIISETAYKNLQDHIARNGPLLDVLELQAVTGFDPDVIRMLRSITLVSGREIMTQSIPFGDLFVKGQNEIYLRWGRTLQESDGYLGEDPAYEGNPDKLYLRYRHRNANTLSYGFTAEKDAGEAFFRGSNPYGFDFYSFHLALQQYRSWLPAVMLGDFNANFGQGLIMHSGFGAGKSSFVTNVKRSGNHLRPYTSVDENNFLRGAAATVRPMDHLTVTVLASSNKRDANLLSDTIYDDEGNPIILDNISSLQTSNLHRTESEIADENAIDLNQVGVAVAYDKTKYHIAVNGLYSKLGAPLNRNPDLYNQYYFNGDQLINTSIDYGAWIGGVHVFGETAMSDNGAISTLNGLLAGLDRHITAAIVFRSYARDYQALTPNAFGESSLANNETGLYTGIEITPSPKWKIQVYQDIWRHPWLKFNTDAPSTGSEYYGRVTYTQKRRLEIYIQYLSKRNGINYRPVGDAIAEVIEQHRSNVRLHMNNMLTRDIQLRSRLEWTFYKTIEEDQHGFMIYQDVIYSPIASPWTLSARVALFDTDAYDTRAYTFENDLIYYYTIPAFSGRGSRYYLNVRYKGVRNLTLEGKFAQTRYLDVDSIGSGNDEIAGNIRSEIRFQMIYRFGK